MAISIQRALRACTVLIGCVVLSALFTQSTQAQAIITVDVSTDISSAGGVAGDGDGDCELREALENANTNSDTTGGDCDPGIGTGDVIEFDINSNEGTGPHTIVLGAAPALNASEEVIIDGTTETGWIVNTATVCSNAVLMVVIDASAVTGPGGQRAGLRLTSPSTVKGLVIQGAPHNNGGWGIQIAPAGGGSTVVGNFIGTNSAGTAAAVKTNKGAGVYINNSGGSTIGGTTPEDRNIISGNEEQGVRISNPLGATNVVQGNCIGTNAAGTAAIPNASGVLINRGATMNTIGGANGTPGGNCTGACNVISGNLGDGVFIARANNVRSNFNIVEGNYIGTNPAGDAPLPNGDFGVEIQSSDDNTIGGTSAAERNVISGNTNSGVKIASGGSTGNTVQGNFIGVDAAGTSALPNSVAGVELRNGATMNTVGGTASGAGNVISGNTAMGVLIGGPAATPGNEVLGNFIGTDITGTSATLGNGGNGVQIQDISTDTIVGDGTAAGRNIISNNGIGTDASNDHGIRIIDVGTTGTIVQGNYIGTDITGTLDLGNVDNGVVVGATDMTTVGGTTGVTVGGDCTGACNLISGNGGAGININSGATNTTVEGNYIGTDIDGDTPLANDGIGVVINAGSSLSIIGGTTAEARNLISGNGTNGVNIQEASFDNEVMGNYIGVNVAGTGPLGNIENGVYISSAATTNTIGGTAPGAGNLISSNGANGVLITGTATLNLVQGNTIGPNVSGTSDLGNSDHGVLIQGAASNTVGMEPGPVSAPKTASLGGPPAMCMGACNLISGNDRIGVFLDGVDADDNVVSGNYIGTALNGDTPMANGEDGVRIHHGSTNTIGGPGTDEGNLISANGLNGVVIFHPDATDNAVEGNYIGTDITGMLDRGNVQAGVHIAVGTTANTVGGTAAGAGNLISGNNFSGIQISGTGTSGMLVQGNYIGTQVDGTTALGNDDWGVAIFDSAFSNTIGGTAPGAGNIIAFNGEDGVLVRDDKSDGSTVGNTISENAIFENTGIGIDHEDDGPTANDPGDTDGSPNKLQNTPKIISFADAGGGMLDITYLVDTVPVTSATYPLTIEFFEADADEEEGKTLLGTDTYSAGDFTGGPSKMVTITASVPAVLLATATDADGNTSEFSVSVDLEVTKTESIDPVVAGSSVGNLTYVVTVTNNGPGDATGVALEEVLTLPSGVTVDSVMPSAGLFSDPTWTLGDLALGASETLTVVLTVDATTAEGTDVIDNTATVTALNESDTVGGNDMTTEATSVTREVDLEVTKTDTPDPVVAGSGAGNLTYVVTVINNGPSDASGIELSDVLTLPAGVTVDSATPSTGAFADPTWMLGDLALGASETLTVVLTVDATTAMGSEVIDNTATVTALNETDTDSGNDSAIEATSVTREVDLEVSKSESSDPVLAGSGAGNLTYIVTVTNNGPADASGVELDEVLTLPAGVTVDSVTPSAGLFSDPTWTLGDLALGASETLTVVLTVDATTAEGTDVIADTAMVTAVNELDIDPSNDLATEHTSVIREVDLEVTKTESSDSVVAGSGSGNLTYLP